MTADTDARQTEIETQNADACPVVEAIQAVGTPWRMNVVHALADDEECRFNELKRATGARSKTLSDALEALVDADVVTRRMEEAAPVAVYYTLTPKGDELLDVLADLDAWARRWDGDGDPTTTRGSHDEPATPTG
jgi:DNA-binding HxlR family transcriptional regulator